MLTLFIVIWSIFEICVYVNIGPGGAFEIPATDDDVDHIATNSKQLKPVTEAHQQIVDMMNEDCAHLLRKAQSAVSKATV